MSKHGNTIRWVLKLKNDQTFQYDSQRRENFASRDRYIPAHFYTFVFGNLQP